MADINYKTKLGWLPDWPDFRDKTEEDNHISPKLSKLGEKDSVRKMKAKLAPETATLPTAVNLSQWFPPV